MRSGERRSPERHGTDEKLIAARVAMVEEAGRFWWLMDDDDLKWIDKVRSEKP